MQRGHGPHKGPVNETLLRTPAVAVSTGAADKYQLLEGGHAGNAERATYALDPSPAPDDARRPSEVAEQLLRNPWTKCFEDSLREHPDGTRSIPSAPRLPQHPAWFAPLNGTGPALASLAVRQSQ
eukprot:scaffold4409_cov369-Prasinococcus_capsulatus_cf.AAC.22